MLFGKTIGKGAEPFTLTVGEVVALLFKGLKLKAEPLFAVKDAEGSKVTTYASAIPESVPEINVAS